MRGFGVRWKRRMCRASVVIAAFVLGVPAATLAQSSAPQREQVQPIQVTVPLPPGSAAAAATERVRQAALTQGADMTREKAQAAIGNKTMMTFSPDGTRPPMKRYDAAGHLVADLPAVTYKGHGTQIEFLSVDGKAYLWYPGNRGLVLGEWKLDSNPFTLRTADGRANFDLVTVCFRYITPSVNPVTGSTGSNWSCRPVNMYLKGIVESASGDVFSLSQRQTPPFVLDPERTTIASLKKKASHM